MKKFKSIYWIASLFLVCLFSSCDDELIEGTFIQETDLCTNKADVGKMRTLIDTVDFHVEIAGIDLIVHDNGFHHFYVQAIDQEFGDIFMNINDPEIGIFDLETPNEMGFASTFNHHEALTSFGLYSPKVIDDEIPNPYVTFVDNEGFGEFEITLLDYEELLFSGTFSFTAKRLKKDLETGELILDENGEPIVESIEISCGYINEAPFMLSGGGNQSPIFNEFYAEVDGVEFVESSISVENNSVNGSSVLYITALTGSGRLMRIDVPIDLEEGTFAFEPISDGSKLTAVYNNGGTSEGLTPNPGTITITEFDKVRGVIEATFSFRGTDPFGLDPTIVEVTNGELKVNFDGTSDTAFYLEANVDGTAYRANEINTIVSNIFGTNVVTVSTSNASSIDLIFPENIEVGSYNMSPNVLTGNEKVGLFSPVSGGVTSHRSNPGTLTILRYDELTGEIEGAFEFEAKDPLGQDPTEYSVTNGVFLVRII